MIYFSLREKCSNLRQSTIQNESKKRCELLRENNNANILMLSDYLDKVMFTYLFTLHTFRPLQQNVLFLG